MGKPYHHSPSSVDSGYAWVVLASCFVLRALVDAFWTSLGILFLKWQTHFDVSVSNTAWIGSIFMLILLSSAPISSALGHRLTYRVTVIGAGIVIFSCLCAISLTNQFWQIYMFIPILSFAFGIAGQTGTAYFIVFFDKRLALANGLNSAASAVGILMFPPLMEILISYYGWRGALQITSAIMSNICVCGALLRNPPKVKRLRTNSSKSKLVKERIPDEVDSSELDTSCCNSFFKDIARSFDLSLFRKLTFVFQGIGNGILYGGNNTAILYLVPYAVSVGIANMEASYLMFAFGISGLAIRLCPVGWIVDKKFISASTLGGIAFLMCGLNIVITSFVRTFSGLVIVAVVYGVTVGVAAFLRVVVVTYAAGSKAKAPGAIGWMLLGEGVGSLACILLMGFLHDISGNYRAPLIVSGVCVMCLGINMLLYPLQVRCQHWIDTARSRQAILDIDSTQNFARLVVTGKETSV
ncbi:monocarboxylate transporter 12-like [Amphiura filiformis]|uniref:monocarboxylate transporter 12-like n=1 Tax=Amphiura filiformis TaxID=82378 RepID=UPI003B21C675